MTQQQNEAIRQLNESNLGEYQELFEEAVQMKENQMKEYRPIIKHIPQQSIPTTK